MYDLLRLINRFIIANCEFLSFFQRPRTTITEITEQIYIQQVVTERVTTRVNVTDDKTAHDDSGATYVIAFETESASIEIEFNYLTPFKRNMHRFRQIALMGRGLGYDGSWEDEITPRWVSCKS